MPKLSIKNVKGKKYVYLEESVRIGDHVRNLVKYLGPHDILTKKKIREEKRKFKEELLQRKVKLSVDLIRRKISKFEYPLNTEEVGKIEEMNFKHKQIMRKLHPKNFDDLNKRFIANYVFESNALEGNTLTLKNVAEIVFEKRISKGKDLREIYDAQNSYNLFLYLQKTRKKIDHNFVTGMHAKIMDRIDDRLGYRKVPIMLLGKPSAPLSKPENIHRDMDDLLKWYRQNEDNFYPLELAFKFHAKFERIHPFSDGNGRTGRFLLNYVLMRKGYFPIIIRKTNRNTYLKALEAADREKWVVLMRFALTHYKKTFRKFFEIYFDYAK